MKAIEGLKLKMDRKDVSFSQRETHRKEERDYWLKAPIEGKVSMITYLRECFYGAEATTGRLQRIFEFSKQKRC
jgi:hypothetical protein